MRLALYLSAAVCMLYVSCGNESGNASSDNSIDETRKLEGDELVKRGEYLVTIGGCNDCHSPKVFNPHGFTFDSSRLLSGHPAGSPLPPIDAKTLKPGNWITASPDLTAWVGPWGMTLCANLTPDSATGIGNWNEENFIGALRKGKHLGMDNGRPIMPPMPWEVIGKMTDEDLKAVFAYLKSIPPINNRVPDPLPPPQVPIGGASKDTASAR